MEANATTLNLASALVNSTSNYANKTAIVFGEQKFTYSQINAISNMIANGLTNKGIKKGDKVALSMLNLPYFPMIYYGILKTGAVVVPLNVLLKRDEIEYHLKDSDSKAYFSFVGTPELKMGEEAYAGFNQANSCEHFFLVLPPGMESPIPGVETLDTLMKDQSPAFQMVQTLPNDPAVILYTSGTTGHPKGAELSHNNIHSNAMASTILLSSTLDDVHCIALPLFHSFGQTVQLNLGILMGNTLVLIAKFTPDAVLSAFQNEGVTHFAGVPTMYWAMLNYPKADEFDLEKISNTLKLGVSGGSAMPVEVMTQFTKKFKIKILEGYGLSETAPVASFSRSDLEFKAGSVGVPIRGVEMMISDPEGNPVKTGETGEILIRGPNIMRGYYNKPEATKKVFEGGWFHSGDVGKQDEDGYYYIVDRMKDMIIRGGFNVYPREIEEVMMTHPKVSLVAVVGEQDNQYGEEVAAYVVLKDNQEAAPDEIRDWCKEKMAAYKYPRKVYIKDMLPMTATGKILKRVLRE